MPYKFTAIPSPTDDPKSVAITLHAARDNLIALGEAFIRFTEDAKKNSQHSLANFYGATDVQNTSGILKLSAQSDVLFIVSYVGAATPAGATNLVLTIDGNSVILGSVTILSGNALPTTLFKLIKSVPAGLHTLQASAAPLNGVMLTAMALSA